MTDLEHILPLWHELELAGSDYVLATVVETEGSSYRRPGARMLLAHDGRRAGTVSGGCLEAEVARRAWWLTGSGPVMERYSTSDDDGDMPYGSGCGGVVYLLLERKLTAGPHLRTLEESFKQRLPIVIATVIEGAKTGTRAYASLLNASPESTGGVNSDETVELQRLAEIALDGGSSYEQTTTIDGEPARVWVDYRTARPGLWIFGAGDDAKPLLALARELGWFVAVLDGRSHLATRDRFKSADEVRVLPVFDLPANASQQLTLRPTDAAVVMTHSFAQDSRILASLLSHDFPLAYLGVLGPQRRTRELLGEVARLLNLPNSDDRVERWLAQLHAPTGLDLGADTPASIALSILAEIQKALTAATGQPLRQVRAAKDIVSRI